MNSQFSEKYRDLFVLKKFEEISDSIKIDSENKFLGEIDRAILELADIIYPVYLKCICEEKIFKKLYDLNSLFKIHNEEFGIVLSSVLLSNMFHLFEEYDNAFKIMQPLMDYPFMDIKNNALVLVRIGKLMCDTIYNVPLEKGITYFYKAIELTKSDQKYYIFTLSYFLHYNGIWNLYKSIENYADEFKNIVLENDVYRNYRCVINELEFFMALEKKRYKKFYEKAGVLIEYYVSNNRLLEAFDIYELLFKVLRNLEDFERLKVEGYSLFLIGDAVKSTKMRMRGLEIKILAEITLSKNDELLRHYQLYLLEKEDFIAKKQSATIIHNENKLYIKLYEKDEELFRVKNRIIQEKNRIITSLFEELKNTQKYLLDFDKLKQVGEFAASICHDLNTPIGAIHSSANTLKIHLVDLFSIENMEAAAEMLPEERVYIYDELKKYDFQGENQNMDFREKKRREEQYAELLKDHPQKNKIIPVLMDFRNPETIDTILEKFSKEMDYKKIHLIGTLFGIMRKVNTINIASNKITRSLSSLRTYTRFDEKEFLDTDLVQTIESAISLIKDNIGKNVSISFDFQFSPIISGVYDDLVSVWTNLLQNAVYAVKYEGNISIRTYKFNDQVYIEFENDGDEIPAHIREKMFQAFFTTKPIGMGSGLGLNICKKICIEHKGEIRVSSDFEKTIFTVNIPYKS